MPGGRPPRKWTITEVSVVTDPVRSRRARDALYILARPPLEEIFGEGENSQIPDPPETASSDTSGTALNQQ